MAKDDELKKSVKELVKEIVSDTVSKLVKASAQKTVTKLRDKLKEEAAKRVEDKLKKTAKKLHKDLSEDAAKDSKYLSKFKEAFEEEFQKLLTSLSRGLLKPLIIASAAALVVGGVIGGLVVYNITEPAPPLPDLVITEVTFDIEKISEIEPEPEIEPVPEPFTTLIWLWEDTSSYQVTIYYTVKNQGDKAADPSTSRLYLGEEDDDKDTPEEDDKYESKVGPIAAGDTAEGSFTYAPFSLECLLDHIEIRIRADFENSIDESNEENNCFTLKLNPP